MSDDKKKKPSRPTRKKKVDKLTLKEKLRQKLNEKKLFRTSRVVRDNEMDELEKKIKSKSIPSSQKKKLKQRLDLLQKVEDKEIESYENTLSGDFVDYTDS